jgi:RNA polymerase sigma-70 factor (ECF subfamily)
MGQPHTNRSSPTLAPDVEVDDATLALAAARGDQDAHTAIWDRYSELVRRILVRALGAQADVEDRVQEVFIRFYRNRKSLRDPAALRSFLFGIALRVAATELRVRRMRSWLRLTRRGYLNDVEGPGADEQVREAVRRLYQILDRLDATSRLALVLHTIEGWDLAETATALGTSVATVKRRLSRALPRVLAVAKADSVLALYLSNQHTDSRKSER